MITDLRCTMLHPKYLLLPVLLAGLIGCAGERPENVDRYTEIISQVVETNRQLRTENKKLTEQVAAEERHVREATQLITSITEGLADIAQREAEVREVMTNVGTNLNRERPDTIDMQGVESQIDSYVAAIDQHIQENKERLEQLRNTVRSSKADLAAYESTIRGLKNVLAKKEAIVADLRNDMSELRARVETLEVEKDTLQRVERELRSRNELLRQAYYVVSTRKDLDEKNIVNDRFLRSTELNQHNPEHFTSIDMTVEEIPLPKQRDKAKVFSIHNREPHLYDIQEERLVINDPEQFWTVSRYLIVEIDR